MSSAPQKYVVRRLKDKKEYITYKNVSDVVVEYPHDWFDQNPGKKPPVVVPRTTLSKDALSRAVYKQFLAQNLPSTLVRTHIYEQLKDISEICPDDWKTFGVSIAKKGDRVRVFDMFEVKREDLQIDEVDDANKPEDEVLSGNIFCICQLNMLQTKE